VVVAIAVVVVAGLLLWVLFRPTPAKKSDPRLSVVPDAEPLAAPDNRAKKKTPAAKPKPSVDVPENTSSTRWVGALIDKHPDEAAAVLKRWIQEK
jgi:flagellar biosynthesis/type III secretory pathway M-ring protein FliF/YscJ